jgi:RimJ/RimL family protein N-acetyltransferase
MKHVNGAPHALPVAATGASHHVFVAISANLRPDISLEPATEVDITFLSALAADPAVAPFLMVGASDADSLRSLLTRDSPDGMPVGLFVIRLPAGERVGGLALRIINRRSRICELSRLMISTYRRRTGIAAAAVTRACRLALVDFDLHRIQAEVYGDNLPGQALFERVGFVREGTRRRAYWRRGQWQDGILFGMLADELGQPKGRDPDGEFVEPG